MSAYRDRSPELGRGCITNRGIGETGGIRQLCVRGVQAVSEQVCLLAPEVREESGVVARLRRYERALTERGCIVHSQAYRNVQWPQRHGGHTHILDPVALVRTLLHQSAYAVATDERWWPPLDSAYSVTVARPLDEAGEHVAQLAAQLVHGARAVLAASEAIAQSLVYRHGMDAAAIAVAPTPLLALPEQSYSPDVQQRIRTAVADHQHVLLCVTGLGPGRGIERFLRLTEATRYVHPKVVGLLVGPVLDVRYTRTLLPQLAQSGVVYAGAVAQMHMAQFYAQASLLVEVAEQAALSAAVGEALAQALPVIAHHSAWADRVRPGGLELYEGEAQALRLIDAQLRMPFQEKVERSAQCAHLATLLKARNDREGQYLYHFCTVGCIDGERSLG